MKKLSLVTLVLLVLCTSFAFAQQFAAPPEDGVAKARAAYEQLGSQALAQPKGRLSTESLHTMGAAIVFPGDNAKFFMFRANVIFPEPGEKVKTSIIPIQNIQGPVYFYGRRTFQDKNGATSEYFQPTLCNGYGYCEAGLKQWSVQPALTIEVSVLDRPGSYSLDVIMVDKGGSLLQQAFLLYHVIQPGPFGRYDYHVDHAEIVQNQNQQYVRLTGRFPSGSGNTSMLVMLGNVGIGGFSNPFETTSVDGFTATVPLGWGTSQELPLDVIILFPSARYTSTLPKAILLEPNVQIQPN